MNRIKVINLIIQKTYSSKFCTNGLKIEYRLFFTNEEKSYKKAKKKIAVRVSNTFYSKEDKLYYICHDKKMKLYYFYSCCKIAVKLGGKKR